MNALIIGGQADSGPLQVSAPQNLFALNDRLSNLFFEIVLVLQNMFPLNDN